MYPPDGLLSLGRRKGGEHDPGISLSPNITFRPEARQMRDVLRGVRASDDPQVGVDCLGGSRMPGALFMWFDEERASVCLFLNPPSRGELHGVRRT